MAKLNFALPKKMKNYTSSELQEMQRQAIERVREMQKKSQAVSHQANIDLGQTKAGGEERLLKARDEQANHTQKDRPRSVQLDTGLAELYKNKDTEKKRSSKKTVENNINSLSDLSLDLDFDKILVLSLILLLASENADMELVLALLYIVI